MKTRTRELKDGGHEIIRLLSLDEIEDWSNEDPLAYERSIVWLEDVSRLPYVRSKTVKNALSRRGPIHLENDGQILGYSRLTTDAPRDPVSNGYVRRIFYLTTADANADPADVPSEAIDPNSILPGVPGKLISAAEAS